VGGAVKPYPRALLWTMSLSSIALMAAALWLPRKASAAGLTAGITALLGLVGVDRWAAAWAIGREKPS
jgi:hypothetical protein